MSQCEGGIKLSRRWVSKENEEMFFYRYFKSCRIGGKFLFNEVIPHFGQCKVGHFFNMLSSSIRYVKVVGITQLLCIIPHTRTIGDPGIVE